MKPSAAFGLLLGLGEKFVAEHEHVDADGSNPPTEEAQHLAPLVAQVRAVLPIVASIAQAVDGDDAEERALDRSAFVRKLASDLVHKSMTPLAAQGRIEFKFIQPAEAVALARMVLDECDKAERVERLTAEAAAH